MIPVLAGANIIFGMGMMELGETFSLVQLVIDNMIVEDIKKIVSLDLGVEALSVSEFVNDLTGKGFPVKSWSPFRSRGSVLELYDRKVKGSALRMTEEAGYEVQSILSSHKPRQLTSYTSKRIKELVTEAGERRRNYLGSFGK